MAATDESSDSHADVQSSTAILEVKLIRLKRALAACIEQQAQLQEENTKLRRIMESERTAEGYSRYLLGHYESKVGLLLAYLRDEADHALFLLIEDVLKTKLTSETEYTTKSDLAREMTLLRERRHGRNTQSPAASPTLRIAPALAPEEGGQQAPRSVAPHDDDTDGRSAAAAEIAPTKASLEERLSNEEALPQPPPPSSRRHALRPRRRATSTHEAPDADVPGPTEPTSGAAVEELREVLSAQETTIAALRSEVASLNSALDTAKRKLTEVVVRQLTKAARRSDTTPTLSTPRRSGLSVQYEDQSELTPAVLESAAQGRIVELKVIPGTAAKEVFPPLMPPHQNTMMLRSSRYGSSTTSSPHQLRPSEHDTTPLQQSTGTHQSDPPHHHGISSPQPPSLTPCGYAFRIALSTFLKDVAVLLSTGERACQRLEAFHDKLLALRLQSTSGVPIAEAKKLSGVMAVADLFTGDFDRDTPDALREDHVLRRLLDSDASWQEELGLLDVCRKTLVEYLRRRVEHWVQRIGSHISVKHDPRKLATVLSS